MLISMLLDTIDGMFGERVPRIRKVYVATPDGTLHEVIGVERSLGGDLVLVAEPQEQR